MQRTKRARIYASHWLIVSISPENCTIRLTAPFSSRSAKLVSLHWANSKYARKNKKYQEGPTSREHSGRNNICGPPYVCREFGHPVLDLCFAACVFVMHALHPHISQVKSTFIHPNFSAVKNRTSCGTTSSPRTFHSVGKR